MQTKLGVKYESHFVDGDEAIQMDTHTHTPGEIINANIEEKPLLL